MPARYFVDENDLALGKRLAELHEGIVFPGHIELPQVPRGARDDEWLAVVGVRGLVVITRDARIRYRPVERLAWISHRVRGFVLTGKRSQSTADSLTVLERQWARIEALAIAQPEGPWMRAVTTSGIREIRLA